MNRSTTFSTFKRGQLPFNQDLLKHVLLAAMTLASVVWLTYQYWRLLFQPDPLGAIDLKQRMVEIQAWTSGEAVYHAIPTAVYPPASYLLLWPFVGWLPVEAARSLWAATSVASLIWLIYILRREARVATRTAGWFVSLLPLSIYATGATLGNGQLLVHLMPPLLASLLLLRDGSSTRRDVLAGCLFIFALTKPSATAPFFWILVFAPKGWRVPVFVLGGYSMLTFVATLFQEASAFSVLKSWVQVAQGGVAWGTQGGAYANQGAWLNSLGLEQYTTGMSLVMLLGAGIWTALHRHVDIWLLLAGMALVARFWTYHYWYDDLLLLVPLITIYRLRCLRLTGNSAIASSLILLNLLCLMAPGGLYLLPHPWKDMYITIQVLTWVATLLYIARISWTLRLN